MIGSLNKSYEYSAIVTADDLKALSDVLSSHCEELQYTINTKDGARYTLNSLDDVLQFSNPDDRKIQRICIKGNKRKGDNFIYPNVSISLMDKSVYVKSCELEIINLEETEICYYTQRVDEFVKRIRPQYWWLHKSAFYWIVGIVLYFLSAFLYQHNVDNTEPANKVYNILVLQGVSAICMAFSMFVLEKIVFYFFPECCFAIGEQIKHKDKLDKLKRLIFITIICALVIGILSSVLAHFIVRSFN